jgi:hypothetical protein
MEAAESKSSIRDCLESDGEILVGLFAVLLEVDSDSGARGASARFSEDKSGAISVFENVPLVFGDASIDWVCVGEIRSGITFAFGFKLFEL